VPRSTPVSKERKKPTSAKLSIFSTYNYSDLDIGREIEKLYEDQPNDLARPLRFKFIPPKQVLKAMILKYVESILY
jgi:hypothetical protein